MIVGKVWGTTELLLAAPFMEMHRLRISPGSQCSMHMHKSKWNCFVVIEGALFIDVEKNNYALTDVTTLGPGECTTVKPGEYHRFRTGDKACVALELYYPDALSEDIMRRDVGGPVSISGYKRPDYLGA